MFFFRKIWYFTIRILVKIGLHFFYKKITVTGQANIPKNASVLFAANHENAFIDAFLVATSNNKLCNSLVRADVFRFKLSKMILSSLNMLPVYRIRDGYSSLKSNEVVFEACYKAFGNGESLMMFPEATHDDRRIPRKLSKGISRLALGTVNSKLGTDNLYIVPVGLDYSDHKKFRAEVQINYGEAIKVEPEPMEVKYFDALRFKIQEGLQKTHIGLKLSNYETLNQLVFETEGDVDVSKFEKWNKEGEKINAYLGETDEELSKHLEVFKKLKSKFSTKSIGSFKLFSELILAIMLLPLFIVCLAINSILLGLIYAVDRFMITDKVFISSINFTIGLFLFPVLWYFQYNFLIEYYSSDYLNIATIILLPFSLLFFQYVKDFYFLLFKNLNTLLFPKAYADYSNSLAYLKAYKTKCLN